MYAIFYFSFISINALSTRTKSFATGHAYTEIPKRPFANLSSANKKALEDFSKRVNSATRQPVGF